MRTLKRHSLPLLIALLVLSTLLFSVPQAFAASFFEYTTGGIIYHLYNDNGERYALVYNCDLDVDIEGHIVIPASVTNGGFEYPVTRIDEDSFYEEKGITKLTIPASVEEIGYHAFLNCSNVTEIVFLEGTDPKPLVLGEGAFASLESLQKIHLPDRLTEIGDNAFEGCEALEEVTFGSNSKLQTIGARAFYDTSIKNFTVPASVTTLKDRVFYSSGIETFDARNSQIKKIDESTFTYCYKLKSVLLPETIKEIGKMAFAHCSSLSSITLPNSVETLGDDTFTHATGLTEIKLPENDHFTTIPSDCFYGCTSLEEITIPASVTSLEDDAFALCTALRKVEFEGEPWPTRESNTFYSTALCESGHTVLPSDPSHCYFCNETVAATVTDGGAATNYFTIKEAIAAAQGANPSAVLTLLDHINKEDITTDRNTYTIRLGGLNLENSTITISGNADVTVMNDSALGNKDYNIYNNLAACEAVFVVKGGKLTLGPNLKIRNSDEKTWIRYEGGAIAFSEHAYDQKICQYRVLIPEGVTANMSSFTLPAGWAFIANQGSGAVYTQGAVPAGEYLVAYHHDHNFTFSSSGDTITAVCSADNCKLSNRTQSVKLKAPGYLTYSSFVKEALLEGGIDGFAPVIQYSAEPKEVGTYTATIAKDDRIKAQIQFTIVPATPKIKWNGNSQTIVYNGSDLKAMLDAKLKITLLEDDTYDYSIIYSYSDGNTTPVSGLPNTIGTFQINAAIPAQGNYTAAETATPLTLTITAAPTTLAWKQASAQLPYTGSAPSLNDLLELTLAAGDTYNGEFKFTYEGDAGTVNGLPTEPGVYAVKASFEAQGNYLASETDTALNLTITKTISDLNSALKVFNDDVETSSFFFGDTITVKVTPQVRQNTTRRLTSSRTTTPDTLTLYRGADALTPAISRGQDGSFTAEIDTVTANLLGDVELIARFTGDNYFEAGDSQPFTVRVAPKPLTVESAKATDRYYKAGDFTVEVTEIVLSGFIDGFEEVMPELPLKGTLASDKAGTYDKVKLNEVNLSGEHKDYYTVTVPANTKTEVEIIAVPDAPATGDDATPALWFCLVLMSGAILLMANKKHYRTNR